jgi:hypothetical protein
MPYTEDKGFAHYYFTQLSLLHGVYSQFHLQVVKCSLHSPQGLSNQQ